jgi:hypothetical protein
MDPNLDGLGHESYRIPNGKQKVEHTESTGANRRKRGSGKETERKRESERDRDELMNPLESFTDIRKTERKNKTC